MKVDRAIILAGGNATRLYPLTISSSKHLLNVYNKPMIFYPLSTLMLAGIKKFLIISSSDHISQYKKLLGQGNLIGISIKYAIQKKPLGLPEAFIIGKKFIDNKPVCLNLGDHIFFGKDVNKLLKKNIMNFTKTTIFTYEFDKKVQEYGVIQMNNKNIAIKMYEKPKYKISNLVVTGLYIFDKNVYKESNKLKYSKRNELEIADLINQYIEKNSIKVEKVSKKNYWIDAGTPKKIMQASKIIERLENRNKSYYGYIEIIAYKMGYINLKQFKKIIKFYCKNQYGVYLESFL